MEIKLKSITLENFKGIKSLHIKADGNNLNIMGPNGSGKTTVKDAWSWLLFDKDSNNRSDFNVKTLDTSGQAIHYLEHSVEAILTADDTDIILKKMLKEDWVKKRGEEQQTFSGHTISYWIDDVPVKAGEFKTKIAGLVGDEQKFRLITDPFYFNSVMKWQDRRNTLIAIGGNISDETVIASDPKLAKLPGILEGRTIDQHNAMISERISKTKKEIEGISPRIDELTKTLPAFEVDYSEQEKELAELNRLLDDIEKKLAGGTDILHEKAKLQRDLMDKQKDLEAVKRKIEAKANSGVKAITDERHNLEMAIYGQKLNDKSMLTKATMLEAEIKDLEKKLQDLRAEFDKVDSQIFPEPKLETVCPTCGQFIPKDKIDKQYQDMRKAFETDKNKKLDDIETQGLNTLDKINKAKADHKQISEARKNNLCSIMESEARIEQIDKQLASSKISIDYGRDEEYVTIENEIFALNREIEKPIEDKSTELLEMKKDLVGQIDKVKALLNNKENNQKTRDRIDELKSEEKKLAKRQADLEGQKFLLENFTKKKAQLLEDAINAKFKYVNFKLFDMQINGGVAECCETLIRGVPWNDANHEGRTNGGLDIINTLTEHYGVTAPIFIDYRESTNHIIPTKSQVINLIVTLDNELKVEVA